METTVVLKNSLERGLIFIGYFLGIVLVLENIAKFTQGENEQGFWIFCASIILWILGYTKRRKISKQGLPLGREGKEALVKVEITYFLVGYVFVALFLSTIYRYIPDALTPMDIVPRGAEDSSRILTYFTQELPFNLIVNLFVFFVVFLGMLALSQVVFSFFMRPEKGYPTDIFKRRNTMIMSIVGVLFFTLFMMQIPFFNKYILGTEKRVIFYLRGNFQWLMDYLLGSPIFYYLIITFKGSEPLEEFSLIKKIF